MDSFYYFLMNPTDGSQWILVVFDGTSLRSVWRPTPMMHNDPVDGIAEDDIDTLKFVEGWSDVIYIYICYYSHDAKYIIWNFISAEIYLKWWFERVVNTFLFVNPGCDGSQGSICWCCRWRQLTHFCLRRSAAWSFKAGNDEVMMTRQDMNENDASNINQHDVPSQGFITQIASGNLSKLPIENGCRNSGISHE